MQTHTKIINSVSKKILEAEKLTRIGNSNNWIEDHGFYLILVEFQPIDKSQGAFLNVGVSFLWEASLALNTTLAFNYGYRIQANDLKYVVYHGDDVQFQLEIEQLTNVDKKKVLEYRHFEDFTYAYACLNNKNDKYWKFYDQAMLCFLFNEFENGNNHFKKFMQISKDCNNNGIIIKWKEDFYNYCKDTLVPKCSTLVSAHEMVIEMIKVRRTYFSNKPSYKNIKADFEL